MVHRIRLNNVIYRKWRKKRNVELKKFRSSKRKTFSYVKTPLKNLR